MAGLGVGLVVHVGRQLVLHAQRVRRVGQCGFNPVWKPFELPDLHSLSAQVECVTGVVLVVPVIELGRGGARGRGVALTVDQTGQARAAVDGIAGALAAVIEEVSGGVVLPVGKVGLAFVDLSGLERIGDAHRAVVEKLQPNAGEVLYFTEGAAGRVCGGAAHVDGSGYRRAVLVAQHQMAICATCRLGGGKLGPRCSERLEREHACNQT